MNAIAAVGAPVIVLIAPISEVELIFDAAGRSSELSSGKYLWVGTDEWINNVVVPPVGAVGLIPLSLARGSQMSDDFIELWMSLNPLVYPDANGDRSDVSPYSPFAVDAVFALAYAYQDLIESNFVGTEFENRQQAYQKLIRDVGFNGLTGEVNFDNNGDREKAAYLILNFDKYGNWVEIGNTTSGKSQITISLMTWPDMTTGASASYTQQYIPICPAGYEPRDESSGYTCVLCPVGTYKAYSGTESCSDCPEGADCNDVGIVVPCPMPGYWRPLPPDEYYGDLDKYKIFKCDVEKRCNGGCQLDSTCDNHVDQLSPVCGVCGVGHYKVNDYSCKVCPDQNQRTKDLMIFFVLFAIIGSFCGLFIFYALHVCNACNMDFALLFEISVEQSQGNSTSLEMGRLTRDSKMKSSIDETVDKSMEFAKSFVANLKTSGMFVTVKLTLSFIQVLIGSLGTVHISWDDKNLSLFNALNIDPSTVIPLFHDCSAGNSKSLHQIYLKQLLILVIPIAFVITAITINRIILYFIYRNVALKESNKQEFAERQLRNISLKSFIWFLLFSFPILTAG